MYTTDENGLYYLSDGRRMLVSYIRGEYKPVKNPIQNRFEPAYLIEYFPGPVGVTVAFVHQGEIRIGYSKANIWMGDKFVRKTGIEMAIQKAFDKKIEPPFEKLIPCEYICDAVQKMYNRSKNYFKLNKPNRCAITADLVTL